MKKQIYNTVGREDGYSKGFTFKLIKLKEYKTDGEFNAHATYKVRIGDILDIYHTTYLNPTAEPEFGDHTDQFNRCHSLENDVMTCINEHLWSQVSA
jgi:hypothetical protein